MSKQLLEINFTWKGILNDATKQVTDGFVDMSWVDIWTEPWVMQINKRLEVDTTTWMTERPLSQTVFDWKIISWNANEELWYNSTWTTWTLMHTNANNWDNNDVVTYQNRLIYASRTRLWRSTWLTIAWWFTDNATWWAGWPLFTNWWSEPHYFRIFNNRLYISDGNILAELDWASAPLSPSSWVMTPSKFILPEEEVIKSLEVIWSQLAIWTEAWNFYLWDWASANASQIIKASLWWINAMLELENTLYVFAWLNWTVYRYNGADFIPTIQIPDMNILFSSFVRQPAVRKYKNWMIFAIPNNWIYVWNRVKEWESFSLAKYWPLSGGQQIDSTDWELQSLFIIDEIISDDRFLVGYEYNNVMHIDRVSDTKFYRMEEAWSWDVSVAPYIETVMYELRDKNGKPNKVQWIQWMFNAVIVSSADRNNIQIEYRLDRTSAYTVLWIIWENWINLDKILRWIWKRVSKIQFRIKMWWTVLTTLNNTKLTNLKIF